MYAPVVKYSYEEEEEEKKRGHGNIFDL